jgi:hypothetical protein
MTSTVNSDNGAVSGVPGVKKDGDSSGVLALQTNGSSAITVSTSQNATLNSTGAVTLPIGTTAQRPATPANGMTRINTTTNTLEVYSTVNSSWNTVSTFTNATPTVEYLVVAGGGGSAQGQNGGQGGGGGGAGGYRTASGFAVTAGSSITVTVGAGGTGGVYPSTNPTSGSDSVFSSITSTGGGSGGGAFNSPPPANGGSGGGGLDSGGTGVSGQGFAGGTGPSDGAGGGGGAGAVGANGSGRVGGSGGVGLASSITGTSVFRAGGGGGGGNTSAAGGSGGGGIGGDYDDNIAATAGTANTGGGGGGGVYLFSPSREGKAGGSGIVIIRYADTYGAATSTTGSPTITVAGGYRVYTWTSSGTITF